MNKTNIIIFVLLILLAGNVMAQGLFVTAPFKTAYKKGDDIIMRTYIFNSDAVQLQGVQAECNMKLYNNTNYLVLKDNLTPSADTYLYVLNKTILNSVGRYDYVINCNSSTESGFVNSYFDLTIDGHDKDTAPTALLAAIVLIPLLFGFLLLFWAHSLDKKEHNGFKIILSLLARVSVLVSLHFALVTIVKVYYFPELQETIGSTTYWMAWFFAIFIMYWLMYFIIKSFETARKGKIERLEY